MRTVVWGAPCSGKTTHVKEHASEGDVICDYDSLFQALSGLERYQRVEKLKPFAISLTNKFYDNIKQYPELNAWIISATKKRARAEELAEIFDADLVVLEVSREEAHRRCDEDGRPDEWHQYIDEWFDSVEGEEKTVNKSTRKESGTQAAALRATSSALRAPSPAGEGLKTFPRVRNAAESGGENEIWLYGEIYDDYWYEEYGGEVTEYYGIWTPKMIRDSLRRFGNEDVTIHIHSAGGYVEDASAIRAIITSHPGKVTCRIDGLCASAAVMVAISGDRVLMQDSAYLMIHNPWTIALGDVDELKRAIKSLQASKRGIIEAYQSRCNLSAAELDKMMNDETWLTGQEALEAGFVDVILGAKPEKLADEVKATTNRLRNVLSLFRHVPEDVRAMMDGGLEPLTPGKEPRAQAAPASLKRPDLWAQSPSSLVKNETAEGEDSALESAETEVGEATGGHGSPPLLAKTTDKERDEAMKALREKIKNILKEER